MDIKKLIIKKLSGRKSLRTSDIVRETRFSRAYINRFFQGLQNEGKIVLIGKANQARYIQASKHAVAKAKKGLTRLHRILHNNNLSEDIVLDQIKRNTGIFLGVPKNISRIIEYAFSEMLNNAIEHSQSKTIEIKIEKEGGAIHFEVADHGIGIFRHIMKKRGLKNELEAIQDLLKGKQTTVPKSHTGEGIFFTSKIADNFVIQSFNKKLTFNNILEDIFIDDVKQIKGTRVAFFIAVKSRRGLDKIFREYSGNSYEFSKTKVIIKLYKMDTDYISRSQARRVLSGLEAFKTITLDFNGVKTIGQGFADEVFRVWKLNYPSIEIIYKNANDNIRFMINRAL